MTISAAGASPSLKGNLSSTYICPMRKLRLEEVKLLAQGQSFKEQSLDRCSQLVLEPKCWPITYPVCSTVFLEASHKQTIHSFIQVVIYSLAFNKSFLHVWY